MLGQLLMKLRDSLNTTLVQLYAFRHAEPSFHKTKTKTNVTSCLKNPNSIQIWPITPPTIIISSPYTRALETASVYANKISYPVNKIIVDWRISEFEEHHNNPFLPEKSPENDMTSPQDVRFNSMNSRLEEFITELKQKNGVIYIFSHGVILNRLSEYLTGKKIANRGRLVQYSIPYKLL